MDNTERKSNAGRPAKDGIRRSFLIERNISENFDQFCYKTGRNKTRVIELAIEEYMKNHAND